MDAFDKYIEFKKEDIKKLIEKNYGKLIIINDILEEQIQKDLKEISKKMNYNLVDDFVVKTKLKSIIEELKKEDFNKDESVIQMYSEMIVKINEMTTAKIRESLSCIHSTEELENYIEECATDVLLFT